MKQLIFLKVLLVIQMLPLPAAEAPPMPAVLPLDEQIGGTTTTKELFQVNQIGYKP